MHCSSIWKNLPQVTINKIPSFKKPIFSSGVGMLYILSNCMFLHIYRVLSNELPASFTNLLTLEPFSQLENFLTKQVGSYLFCVEVGVHSDYQNFKKYWKNGLKGANHLGIFLFRSIWKLDFNQNTILKVNLRKNQNLIKNKV